MIKPERARSGVARRASPRARPAALAFAALALACAASCGGAHGAEGAPPRPALSGSPAAQGELRKILQRFAASSLTERIALKPELVAFRRRFPDDDLARLADVHLAWIALETRDLRRAGSLAAPIEAAGPGTIGDIARVVRGAALRRAGKPTPAFAALRPLVGKVIDPYVRTLLNAEVVAAAMDAGAWPTAIDLVSVWLRETGDDERTTMRAQVAELLRKMPVEQLARALRDRQPKLRGGAAAGTEKELELRTLLAERLATVAREGRDVHLAKDLLETSVTLLGVQGDAIAQLAGTGTARVDPLTVGLLLSVRSPEARRRGLEIAAGVAHGLGVPGAAAHLVSRDDGGDATHLEDALASLAAEGAAVLIAGADRTQANAAAAFARAQSIPVLLLYPPDSPPDSGARDDPFVFVVGEEPARCGEALAAALAGQGARPLAVVESEPPGQAGPAGDAVALRLSCDAPPDPRALKAAGIQGLVLNGDASCAERALAATPRAIRVALGFEATVAAPPLGALTATAGGFPFAADAAKTPAASARGDRSRGEPQPTLEAWLAAHATAPGWWAALGRDAGVLAWAAVRALPKEGTEVAAEVEERRRVAAKALADAGTDLWTTSARGFGGARVLPREIGVREGKRAR